MARNLRNIGAMVSTDTLVSVTAYDGGYMDYDIAGTNARIGAMGTAGTSRGLLLRTIAAGAALTVLTFTSAGAATFASTVTISAGGLTVSAGTTAVQALTMTSINASGSVTLNSVLYLQGPQRSIRYLDTTGATNRWIFETSGVEAAGDAGSDFFLYRYNNAGAYIATAMQITRATGAVVFAGTNTATTITATAAASAGAAGNLVLGGTQQTTIGANGAASALTANPLGYLVAYVGATKVVIPYYTG